MIESILFYGIPVLALGFWIVSMCLYFPAKKKEKKNPGTVEPAKLKRYRLMFTVLSVIAGVMFAVVVGFMALLFMAVAFM